MRSVELALERALARTLADARRGVPSLAMIAATAPLVGILGVLEQILLVFRCCHKGIWWFVGIAAELSDALYPCAWGLLLGIVTHLAFRAFRAHAAALEMELRVAARELLGGLR